jgi:hypothetical protein
LDIYDSGKDRKGDFLWRFLESRGFYDPAMKIMRDLTARMGGKYKTARRF